MAKRGPKPGRRESTLRRDSAIAALVEAGFDYAEIADYFGHSIQTVYGIMKDRYPFLHSQVLQDRKDERQQAFRRQASSRGPKTTPPIRTSSRRHQTKSNVYVPQESTEELIQRYQPILDYLYEDLDRTLQDVGDQFDLTRERVRQIAVLIDEERYQARKDERRRRREGRKREQERAREEARPIVFCKICGVQLPRKGHHTVYCSDEHREMFLTYLRYQCDEDTHEKQQLATARWMLAHPDKVSEYQLRDSRRRLAGRDPKGIGWNGQKTNAGMRWLVEGSKTWDIAVMAYENSWPVFEMLHPDVQQQVRDAVDVD